MSSGEYFSMSDGEQNPKEKKQSRRELDNLKSQFMDRARQFMDDTALGEGRKALQNLINKVKGDEDGEESEGEENWEGEYVEEDPEDWEEDWEDEEWEEREDPNADLDWNRPEYIRAGYAKPGTVVETARSLEEAQEESYNLRMNKLSSLLSRFGSEDATPESHENTVVKKMEMDKPLFQQQMQKIHALLEQKMEMAFSEELWLHPEVLTLLRNGNTPSRILLFVMASLFASTPENYLTQADQDWIQTLMQRAGFLLEEKAVLAQVEQTFLFPERVHRLYQHLLEEPLQINPQAFEQYRGNLAKLYIYELAAVYDADPQNIIRTLAQHWQETGQEIQAALTAIKPIQEQYARFQERKMSSASMFQKLRTAEKRIFQAHAKMKQLAQSIEKLKQVTHLLAEEEAQERLEHFHTHLVLSPAERTGDQPLTLLELRKAFVQAQLQKATPPLSTRLQPEAVELGPVEQKRAIGRAKDGELKSLNLIQNYKSWRIAALNAPPPQKQTSL